MPTEIKMPQLGESVVEGTISRWLKQPGERVEQYEALLEVTTDKVDTEVPAPEAGVLSAIMVAEGETVRVGTPIAVLDGEDQGSAVGKHRDTGTRKGEDTERGKHADTAMSLQPPTSYISPVVARLAAEYQLDLKQIHGTGQGGRVSKKDVLRFLAEQDSEGAKERRSGEPRTENREPRTENREPRTENREPRTESRESRTENREPRAENQEPRTENRDHATPSTQYNRQPTTDMLPDDAELVPLSPMRRVIAERMAQSVQTAPHVTTVLEVDMGATALHRAKHKADFERQGVNLTFTAYFAQAVCQGLRAVPLVNARFTAQGILMHQRIHLGVAVALDEGLIVPVIRDADEKNLLGLARAINDLATRARTRRLRTEETQDGTFTITNHGVSGSLFATPIINQPQGAILGVGAIQKRPVVVSQNGIDALAIRPMCYLSLTFDHRLMDGATADHFLVAVKRALEA